MVEQEDKRSVEHQEKAENLQDKISEDIKSQNCMFDFAAMSPL